jgi:hypothetical protein
MVRVLTVVVLGGIVCSLSAAAQSGPLGSPVSSVKSESAAANLPDVPPLPRGKSTILGGKIIDIDHVRDQFVLRAYGEKPMKILFDERTQVFRDGNKIPLRDLGPADHASVQTTLDDAKIFALSVHILSANPTGDLEGRIQGFDATSGVLTLIGQGSRGLFTVRVTSDTKVSREGQTAFTAGSQGQNDLKEGALVSLDFQPDNRGQGIAQQITILATPGSTFVFTGTISSMSIASGYIMLIDPRDQRNHQIYFNPRDPKVEALHPGDTVRIVANYDGTRYAATQIAKP